MQVWAKAGPLPPRGSHARCAAGWAAQRAGRHEPARPHAGHIGERRLHPCACPGLNTPRLPQCNLPMQRSARHGWRPSHSRLPLTSATTDGQMCVYSSVAAALRHNVVCAGASKMEGVRAESCCCCCCCWLREGVQRGAAVGASLHAPVEGCSAAHERSLPKMCSTNTNTMKEMAATITACCGAGGGRRGGEGLRGKWHIGTGAATRRPPRLTGDSLITAEPSV